MENLSGNEILALQDRKMDSVVVPEWNNTTVFIREMGAAERAAYEAGLLDNKDKPLEERMFAVKINLVILCACDTEGNRLFKDSDYDALKDKNGDAINRVYEVVSRLNLMTDEDIEEERGNLKPSGDADSISD